MALISLEHVTKAYDGKPVVDDLSLNVSKASYLSWSEPLGAAKPPR